MAETFYIICFTGMKYFILNNFIEFKIICVFLSCHTGCSKNDNNWCGKVRLFYVNSGNSDCILKF